MHDAELPLIGARIWPTQDRRLRRDSGVRVPLAIDLRPGLTVLYGRNGAGKSTVLRALQSALTGLAGEFPVELHFRLPGIDRRGSLRSSDLVGQTVDGQVVDPYLPAPIVIDGITEEWTLRGIVGGIEDEASRFLEKWMSEQEWEIIRDALQTRRFALVPVGQESPLWQIWLTADMGHPAMEPWSREADRLFQDYLATESEDSDTRYDELTRLGHELGAHTATAHRWLFRREAAEGDPLTLTEELVRTWQATGIPSQPTDRLPVLVSRIAEVSRLRWPRALYEADDRTLQGLLVDAVFDAVYKGSDISESSSEISTIAHSHFTRILPDAPPLGVAVAPEHEWPYRQALSWRAGRSKFAQGYDPGDYDSRLRTLDCLSDGEARWARFSALLATALHAHLPVADYQEGPVQDLWPLSEDPQVDGVAPRILLLDEPEAHLHRAAESQMAGGLQELATTTIDYMIVATHSPELLNAPHAHLVWLNDGEAKPLSGVDDRQLDALGLRPSDLLGITRVLLLVEGHHDELLLNLLIGDRLRRSNTRIIAMDGGARLRGAIDSQVLFRMSNAHVVGLLDNMDGQRAREVWEAAGVKAAAEGPGKASDFIKKEFPGSGGSENLYMRDFMRNWLRAAITQPDVFPRSRMTPYGFRKKDILDYLPVEYFSEEAGSWEELHEEHERYKEDFRNNPTTQGGTRGKPYEFKEWFQAREGTRRNFSSDKNIRMAVNTMNNNVPDEFLKLAELCSNVGQDAEEPNSSL